MGTALRPDEQRTLEDQFQAFEMMMGRPPSVDEKRAITAVFVSKLDHIPITDRPFEQGGKIFMLPPFETPNLNEELKEYPEKHTPRVGLQRLTNPFPNGIGLHFVDMAEVTRRYGKGVQTHTTMPSMLMRFRSPQQLKEFCQAVSATCDELIAKERPPYEAERLEREALRA